MDAAGQARKSFDFYGIDVGFIVPIFKRSGLEIEFNLKATAKGSINLFSISFVAY